MAATSLFFCPDIASYTFAESIGSFHIWLIGLVGVWAVGGIWWWNRPSSPSSDSSSEKASEPIPSSIGDHQLGAPILLSHFSQAIRLYLDELILHFSQSTPSLVYRPDTDLKHRGIQLFDLAKQITLLAELEKNQLPFNPRPIDLISFLNQLTDSIQPLLCEERHQLVFRHELSQLLIQVDINLLERVFFNLLLFARPAPPPKGQIIIKLQMVAHRVHIGILHPHTIIPAHQIPFLFSALNPSVSDCNRPGFIPGIELLVAQRLIQLHQGSLSVSSHPQEGTACWIELPMNAGIDTVASPFKLAHIPLIITLLTKK